MTAARDLVRTLEDRLRPLETDANLAWWDANTHADEATAARRAATDLAFSDALADADAFAEIEAARATDTDALTARQLDVLAQTHTPHQVPSDLRRRIIDLQVAVEGTFARHRGEVAGEPVDDNAIAAILRASDDPGLRREAWEASKTVGAAAGDDVRALARLRNEAAHALGYRDHFALALATSEFDEARLFATLGEVDELTAGPHHQWKAALDERLTQRFGVARVDLRPWHYDDPFMQSPPRDAAVDLDPYLEDRDLEALTIRTYEGLGLDVQPIVARSDLFARDGKSQHAFCIDVNRSGDVRVLANVVPNERWTETMLHEFGHGVYFAEVDGGLPWLLRTMHMLTTEGIAMLGGRFVHDPVWLREVAGVPAADVEALTPQLVTTRVGALLAFARWVLVMTNFERALYADPDADLDALWWDLVERYQEVPRPNGRRAPDWAAKIHISVAPVYYQNYLYGEMFASQVAATLREQCDGIVDRAAAGQLLVDRVFRPAATPRWDQLVMAATGAPLSPAFLARDLSV